VGVSLIQLNSKDFWLTVFFTLGLTLFISACGTSSDSEVSSLRVVNLSDNGLPILKVSLVNYEFEPLEIAGGESQTFTLDDGMQGGFSNVNVTFTVNISLWHTLTYSTKKDFRDGDMTIITLKGCRSGEGCDGLYLE